MHNKHSKRNITSKKILENTLMLETLPSGKKILYLVKCVIAEAGIIKALCLETNTEVSIHILESCESGSTFRLIHS